MNNEKEKVLGTLIERWMSLISENLKWDYQLIPFPKLIPLFKDESVSTEHIFLTLYQHDFLGCHITQINEIKEMLQSQIPTTFNHVRFHISQKGKDFINDLSEDKQNNFTGTKPTEEQLTFKFEEDGQ